MPDFAVGYEIRDGEFFWKAERSSLTAERMLAIPKNSENQTDKTQAVEFLREVLSEGETLSTDIEKELRAQIELALKHLPWISHMGGHMGFASFDGKIGELMK